MIMFAIEKRVSSAILTAIRKRRETSSSSEIDAGLHSGPPVTRAKVREVRFSDFAAVADLKRRWGLAADSYENWKRLWHSNPALATMGLDRPMGWVLEAEKNVVGYVGNISQLYRYGGRTLTSVTAHGFVVEPPYRGIGMSLIAAYYRQKPADLYISTGAIAPVGKIARAFKSEALTQTDYATVLFWILNPYPFARAVMTKLRFRPTLSCVGGMFGSLVIAADKIVHRRKVTDSSDLPVTEVSISEVSDAFDNLWMEKLQEKPQLLCERSSATLRWHFDIPGDRGSVRVLCCSRHGTLIGYAVVRNEPPDDTGLRKSIIADMLVKDDEAAVVRALLVAAYHRAKQVGSHILELVGFPPSVRRVFTQLNPHTRKYPTPIFGYKATDPVLHKAISDGSTWYASPFDGDWTLIRPSFSESLDLPEDRGHAITAEAIDSHSDNVVVH